MNIKSTHSFQMKKWLLFGGCALSITFNIAIAAVDTTLVIRVVEVDNDKTSLREARDSSKAFIVSVIWVLCGAFILFDLVGLIGAWNENFCITLTYAIMRTVVSVVIIFPAAIIGGLFWAETVFSLVLCGLAYVYAHVLYKRKNIPIQPPVKITRDVATPPAVHTPDKVHCRVPVECEHAFVEYVPPTNAPDHKAPKSPRLANITAPKVLR